MHYDKTDLFGGPTSVDYQTWLHLMNAVAGLGQTKRPQTQEDPLQKLGYEKNWRA